MSKPAGVGVSGDHNVTNVAGRDIIDQVHVHAEAEFFEPGLDYVEPPRFESPPQARELTEHLEHNRLLLLGGFELSEKDTVAHHIAWRLAQQIRLPDRSAAEDTAAIPVKQWIRTSEPPALDRAFEEAAKPTIFILPQAQPLHLEHDPGRVQQKLGKANHYMVVTTESGREAWGISATSPLAELWCSLRPEELYPPLYLGHFLRKELDACGGTLPEGVYPGGARPRAREEDLQLPLVEALTLLEAGTRLETPDRIRSFVSWLTAQRRSVTPAQVKEAVGQLTGDREALARWYRKLTPRQQLLVLGLGLFDSLFDDQFFAALEVVVDEVWRRRDPFLAAFDYHELEPLNGYFRFTEAGRGGVRIESHSARQRQTLFEMAWRLHRRQILATLPLLTDLVQDAGDPTTNYNERRRGRRANLSQVAEEAFDAATPREDARAEHDDEKVESLAMGGNQHLSRWQAWGPQRELFGTADRKHRFFSATVETLSHLGRLSHHNVDRALLDLAASGIREVQSVAAQTLAKWRESLRDSTDSEQLFFKTLHAWQNEASMHQAIRQQLNQRKGANRYAHIRATVALALGYAALHDPPNQLHPGLVRLVEKLIEDRDHIVRERFRRQTLPFVVSLHLAQLRPTLRRAMLFTDLISPVAMGWAIACQSRPGEGTALLESWREEALRFPAAGVTQPGPRETWLATLALTYGYLDYGGSNLPLSSEEGLHRLQAILKQERHSLVREKAVLALVLQARKNFPRVAPALEPLLGDVAIEERIDLIKALEPPYLAERAKLDGDDGLVTLGNYEVPVWLDEASRPLTGVEEILQGWLAESQYPVAQQFALETLLHLAGSPLAQKEEEWRKQQRQRQMEPVESATTPRQLNETTLQALRQTTWLNRFVLRLLTLVRARSGGDFAAIGAEFHHQRTRHQPEIQLLLERFKRRGGTLRLLGWRLRMFDLYLRHRSRVHATALLGLLLFLAVISACALI